jgi:hypothetical protein
VPTGVVATTGNGSFTVYFMAPAIDGGGVSTYNLVSSSNPSIVLASGKTSPIAFSGLAFNTWTFDVQASNSAGSSALSSSSNSIAGPAIFGIGAPLPGAILPPAPGSPSAVAGDGYAIVSFLPVAGGQLYQATSSPGNITFSNFASPIYVPTLTKGTTYTFTVKVNNGVGFSPASSPTNAVIP